MPSFPHAACVSKRVRITLYLNDVLRVQLLGASIESLRGTSCIMIHPTTRKKKDLAAKDVTSYEALYKKALKKMKALQSVPSS